MASAKFKVALQDAAGKIPAPDGKRFAPVFHHGTLLVKFYIPHGTDPQQPHHRDEAYIVASGSGTYRHADERVPFETGDFLFAEAGVPHCFENFSDDFATWVLFYGPEGGELAIG
jgi:mannose-6-phosphate isomerase-like protein (cupin superfamily)